MRTPGNGLCNRKGEDSVHTPRMPKFSTPNFVFEGSGRCFAALPA